MPQVDYKQKYQELKQRFMNAVDVAWRDGYEHGAKDAQTEQAQMDQQNAMAMDQAAMAAQAGGQPGQEGQEGAENPEEQAQPPGSEHPDGSELDQHIQKLESMLGKNEFQESDVSDLKKTLNEIKLYQGQIALTKSLESIKKAKMRKPFFVAPKAKANLPENHKKTLTKQEETVAKMMKSWEEEEKRAAKDIKNILNVEGLSSKE